MCVIAFTLQQRIKESIILKSLGVTTVQRNLSLDYLRVIATIMVVMIHASAPSVIKYSFSSNWLAGNFYDSLSRAAVPVFVMISGAIFLSSSKEIDIKSFFIKRSLKILIPLAGWSVLYLLLKMFYFKTIPVSITHAIKLFLTDEVHYHFWYLYMIAGIYLITPIVHMYIRNATKKNVTYFLVLWFIHSVILKLISYMFGISVPIELNYVTGYVGYFILGYYLATYMSHKVIKRISVILFFVSVIATALLTTFSSMEEGKFYSYWYEYFSPTVGLTAVSLFLMVQSVNKPLPNYLNLLNETSLGIYLLHPLVLLFLDNLVGTWIVDIHPVIGIPVQVFLIISICMVVVLIMQRIPIIDLMVPSSRRKTTHFGILRKGDFNHSN
jgi:surface polysaccharide O-acyltransferase-like enzyme